MLINLGGIYRSGIGISSCTSCIGHGDHLDMTRSCEYSLGGCITEISSCEGLMYITVNSSNSSQEFGSMKQHWTEIARLWSIRSTRQIYGYQVISKAQKFKNIQGSTHSKRSVPCKLMESCATAEPSTWYSWKHGICVEEFLSSIPNTARSAARLLWVYSASENILLSLGSMASSSR